MAVMPAFCQRRPVVLGAPCSVTRAVLAQAPEPVSVLFSHPEPFAGPGALRFGFGDPHAITHVGVQVHFVGIYAMFLRPSCAVGA